MRSNLQILLFARCAMSADCKGNAVFHECSMKGLRAASITLVLILAATWGTADAQASVCARAISANARAPNGANLVPPQTYDTQKLARSRAIKAWQKTTGARCKGYSTSWLIARAKKVDCEGYAGGVSCRVAARPRKVW
jgi:hypothetical protein